MQIRTTGRNDATFETIVTYPGGPPTSSRRASSGTTTPRADRASAVASGVDGQFCWELC
jgi:hypothetical protein